MAYLGVTVHSVITGPSVLGEGREPAFARDTSNSSDAPSSQLSPASWAAKTDAYLPARVGKEQQWLRDTPQRNGWRFTVGNPNYPQRAGVDGMGHWPFATGEVEAGTVPVHDTGIGMIDSEMKKLTATRAAEVAWATGASQRAGQTARDDLQQATLANERAETGYSCGAGIADAAREAAGQRGGFRSARVRAEQKGQHP